MSREMELLIDLHKDARRQGPGSDEETARALRFTGLDRADDTRILDVGCGSGAQTLALARNTRGTIVAVDFLREFLDKLDEAAAKAGMGDRIETVCASMDDMRFRDGEFDAIWSEGAVYNIGFEKGLRDWKRYLKKGGFVAVSEITWTGAERPPEVQRHWETEYPGIGTVSEKVAIIEKLGYRYVASFVLPDHCWTDNYYGPMERRFAAFLERNACAEATAIVENEKKEIAIYEKHKDHYGYVFYIAQKI